MKNNTVTEEIKTKAEIKASGLRYKKWRKDNPERYKKGYMDYNRTNRDAINRKAKIRYKNREPVIAPKREPVDVYNIISDILKKRGITQVAMAKSLGIRNECLSRICKNKVKPGIKLALQIASKIELPVEDIFKLKRVE